MAAKDVRAQLVTAAARPLASVPVRHGHARCPCCTTRAFFSPPPCVCTRVAGRPAGSHRMRRRPRPWPPWRCECAGRTRQFHRLGQAPKRGAGRRGRRWAGGGRCGRTPARVARARRPCGAACTRRLGLLRRRLVFVNEVRSAVEIRSFIVLDS
jgi:hypothetical protein